MIGRSINPPPKITCIIPCFNEKPSILLESLASVANQTYVNFECIVIDESTDTTIAKICKSFCDLDPRFDYVHPDQRLGLAGSLNLGIERAEGELIARLDSDDICNLDRFAIQVAFLEENPDIDILGSSLDVIDDEGVFIARRRYASSHVEIEKKFIFSNGVAHPTVMFRKSLLSIMGRGYDPTFLFAEDLELWLRLLNKNVKFANLSQPLVQYRQQHTNRRKENWKCNLRARVKNFSPPYRFKKIIGIIAIAIWMYLPKQFRQFFFHAIKLKKG